MSITIGSTVVVQQEDQGAWTHGTVIGKGDQNLHNRSYKMQVTKTGRIVAEDFIHYQANEHTKTDLLDAIPDHI